MACTSSSNAGAVSYLRGLARGVRFPSLYWHWNTLPEQRPSEDAKHKIKNALGVSLGFGSEGVVAVISKQ
eukprot:5670206-Amphidinium_carterae.1